MRKIICITMCLLIFGSMTVWGTEAGQTQLPIKAKSAILMEQTTGKVLYESNADEKMPPASITKIMTLILVMEALENQTIRLEDMVTCSAHAASMGGTQIWLEPNEQMSVNDLIKATAVVSANDASVALAEYVGGSEENFVAMMNDKAAKLGMKNTTFKNATGLDAEGHLSSARDIAIMSRELMTHEKIKEYTTIWMDSLRGGKSELVNTNKLLKQYEGTTGLKTGTTDGAGSCLAATATRNGLNLISATMGSDTTKDRFDAAKILLDYGFNNYQSYSLDREKITLPKIKIKGGCQNLLGCEIDGEINAIIKKGNDKNIKYNTILPQEISAPVKKGQVIGKIQVTDGKEVIATVNITAKESVEKINFTRALILLLEKIFV